MSPERFVSRAKAPPAKRSEKGYGDENGSAGKESGKVFSLGMGSPNRPLPLGTSYFIGPQNNR